MMNSFSIKVTLTQKMVEEAQRFYCNSVIDPNSAVGSAFVEYKAKRNNDLVMAIFGIIFTVLLLPFGHLFLRLNTREKGPGYYGLDGLPDEKLRFVNKRYEENYIFDFNGIAKLTWREEQNRLIEEILSGWEKLYKVFETNKYFYFYFNPELVLVIPKKSIGSQSPYEKEDFRDLLKSKLTHLN